MRQHFGLASSLNEFHLRELSLYRIAVAPKFPHPRLRKGSLQRFLILRRPFLLACCTAQMLDLMSYPMLLELLHKWLSDLFQGVMVLFGCSAEAELQITSSLFFRNR